MTFKRQGLSIPYRYKFIEKIYNNARQNIKMFFAEYDNKVIAANFLIFDKISVYYLMGGIHLEYKDLGGMDLIQYESIKFALNNKLKFDFEGSMIENIEKYFRSFGVIQKPYFQITKTNSKILKIKDCMRDILK